VSDWTQPGVPAGSAPQWERSTPDRWHPENTGGICGIQGTQRKFEQPHNPMGQAPREVRPSPGPLSRRFARTVFPGAGGDAPSATRYKFESLACAAYLETKFA